MAIDQHGDAQLEGVSLRSLPKISLHDHLDGGLRPATIVELADDADVDLPEDDAEALGEWFAEKSDSGSLVEYLKTFDVTLSVMQTREGLTRASVRGGTVIQALVVCFSCWGSSTSPDPTFSSVPILIFLKPTTFSATSTSPCSARNAACSRPARRRRIHTPLALTASVK